MRPGRARARQRPQRHHDPAERHPARACRTARRSVCEPDVLFDLDVTRNRPDCWGYVGIARDVAAKMGIEFRPPTPEPDGRRPRAHGPRRADRRRQVRPVHQPRAVGYAGRTECRVDAAPPRGGGHAGDQQRGRRVELRDARTQPAEPRLRPRHARRRRLPYPRRHRRRADADPRRRAAHVHAETTC